MEHLHNLTQSALVDKLAEYTQKYTRMRMEGGSKEDFNACMQAIKDIRNEISLRKKEANPDSEIISNPQSIFFEK
jgi:hypothetical protein